MSSTTTSTTASATSKLRRKGVIGSALGNALEWYDWNVYAIFSAVFAPSFFPPGSPGTALLQTLAVFAVGFFFRPLGGLLLAAVADRRGRRVGLTLMVSLMAAGSLLIAVSPTYEQVGLVAPVLLLVARIAQGLSTGAEFATVSSYLAEIAPAGRRGLYSSVSYISDIVGTILGTVSSLVLVAVLTDAQLASWGWRLPFVLGGVLGIVTFYIRLSLEESEVFKAAPQERAPLFAGLVRHPRASLQVFCMTIGVTVWFYTFAIYLPTYAKTENPGGSLHIDIAAIIALTIFCVVLPLFGWLSDRWGRRRAMLAFCGLAAVTGVPLFHALTPTPAGVFLVQLAGLLVFAFYGAIAPTLMSEMFPTEVRTAGMGFPYALAVALFGGTAPYVLQWLTGAGHAWAFPWYLVLLCVVSFLASLTLKDRRHTDLRDVR